MTRVSDGRKVKDNMKKLWRRILILSAMMILAMSVRAMADQTQYSAKTITFPNKNGNAGWSNQFTVYSDSNISVGINITGYGITSGIASQINSKLTYVLENVYTHRKYYLTAHISNYNPQTSYEETMRVPAGTYSFGVYYGGTYSFNLYFRVVGSGGINVPDDLEVQINTNEVVGISQQNSSGGVYYVTITSTSSSNPAIADVISKDNTTMPPTITIRGYNLGYTYITAYGSDGSTDQMRVHVVAKKTKPTLLDNDLNMGVGDSVTNTVIGAASRVTWSSSNPKVAKVNGVGAAYNASGKITAVGTGSCVIHAVTTKGGVKYDLACKVNVARSDPRFIIRMVKLFPGQKRVKISITNKSGSPMTVYSKNARLTDWPDYTPVRIMKLKKGNNVTIPNNRTKTLVYNINGPKISMDGKTQGDFGVRVYFKLDGRYYYARGTTDKHLGQYIWRRNFTNTELDTWLFSIPEWAV